MAENGRICKDNGDGEITLMLSQMDEHGTMDVLSESLYALSVQVARIFPVWHMIFST